jgi:hypothetical protein
MVLVARFDEHFRKFSFVNIYIEYCTEYRLRVYPGTIVYYPTLYLYTVRGTQYCTRDTCIKLSYFVRVCHPGVTCTSRFRIILHYWY